MQLWHIILMLFHKGRKTEETCLLFYQYSVSYIKKRDSDYIP